MTFKVMMKIYGEPVAKGRPRFTRQGRAYTPAKTKGYEDEIKSIALGAMAGREPLETPVAAYVYITYAIPESYSKKRKADCLEGRERPKKNDIDNVCKAILDACNGIVYLDDKQVCDLHATKRFGDVPMVEVLFREELL